jgi:hypothetical protein
MALDLVKAKAIQKTPPARMAEGLYFTRADQVCLSAGKIFFNRIGKYGKNLTEPVHIRFEQG